MNAKREMEIRRKRTKFKQLSVAVHFCIRFEGMSVAFYDIPVSAANSTHSSKQLNQPLAIDLCG